MYQNKVTNYQFLVNNFPRVFHFSFNLFSEKVVECVFIYSQGYFVSHRLRWEGNKSKQFPLSIIGFTFSEAWKDFNLKATDMKSFQSIRRGKRTFLRELVLSHLWAGVHGKFSFPFIFPQFRISRKPTETFFDRESFIKLSIKLPQFREALKLSWNKLWKSISDCKYKSLL